MRARPALILLSLGLALFSACRRSGERADLTLAGSTSIQPFADKWAEVFMETHPDYGVNVQGGGSSAGIQACKSGACQIGMSSRELKQDEKDLVAIVVARDGLAVIVHPSNPVREARVAEIKQIFAGTCGTGSSWADPTARSRWSRGRRARGPEALSRSW